MDLSPYQNITKYLDRIARRPAYQKATVIANRTASARGD
jgi:hypothetical protein